MIEYELTKEESERIDILKFIAIIFVVFIHSHTTNVDFAEKTVSVYQPAWLDAIEFAISQVIACCGVPLFFVISAMLFFRKKRAYLLTLKQKVKTLLIPYLLWNSIWVAVFYLLQSMPFTSDYFSGSHTLIKDCDLKEWLQLYGIGSQCPQDYPLWFVRDLMVVILFFPLIDKLTARFPKAFFCMSVVLLLLPVEFPFSAAVLWTIIGACMVKLQIRMKDFDVLPMPIISAVYVITATVLVSFHLFNIRFTLISTAFIFLGIIFWIMLTKYIYNNAKSRDVFIQLSKWTFIIYVAHELTLSSIRKVCFRVFPSEPIVALCLYFIIPFFVVLLCVTGGKILKSFMPQIYELATGGRS